MRKTLLLATLAALISTFAFSQNSRVPSTVQFFTQENVQFSVWVNGMKQNMQPTNRYTLTNLTSNGYLIKIEFASENAGPPLERHFPVTFYTDYVYEIRREENSEIEKSAAGLRNEVKNIFGGKVTKEEEEQTFRNVKWDFFLISETNRENVNPSGFDSGTGSNSSVNTNTQGGGSAAGVQGSGGQGGTTSVNAQMTTSDSHSGTSTTTTTTTSENHSGSGSAGGNGGSGSVSINMTVNDGMGTSSGSSNVTYEESTTVTTTTTTTTSGGSGAVIMEEPSGCYPMADYDFSEAKGSIRSKTFSDSKMSLAKQVTRNNCLTAGQVKEIVALFDFESDRLDYAKFAYDFCYDPNNYFKVNDAFEFESTIEELDEYINSRR